MSSKKGQKKAAHSLHFTAKASFCLFLPSGALLNFRRAPCATPTIRSFALTAMTRMSVSVAAASLTQYDCEGSAVPFRSE